MPTATVDRSNAPEITLTVKLEPEDYRTPAKEELKKLARGAKLKGFRPGKVPTAYMQKLYGKGVIVEQIGKSVDKAINDLIEEEKLEVFGQLEPVDQPDLDGVSFDLNEELVFTYSGGLMPAVEEVDLSGLSSLNRYSVALSDEEATEKLDNARRRFVDYIERDTVESEDDFASLVVADPELDAKFVGAKGDAHSAEPTVGNDAKDGADADSAEHAEDSTESEENETDPRQRYFLRPSEMTEEQRYKLVDKAVGTEVILAVADLNEDVRSRFESAITEDGTTSFTITKVDREQMPELDEDTLKKIFGEETDVTDAEGAKAEFSRRFAENSQDNLDNFALEQVIDKLAADNDVAVPYKAVRARLEQARADELAKAEKEEREPEFGHDLTEADRYGLTRRLKWMAFRQNLIKKYEIELESTDIDRGIEQQYAQQLGGMGLDPNQYRAQFFDTFKRNLIQNREQVLEMTDGLLNQKLLLRLEEEGALGKQQEVGEQEFSEIVEEYNKRVGDELNTLREKILE